MEIFFSDNIDGRTVILPEDESAHCVRVLRHRAGDSVCIIDGRGNMMKCTLVSDSPKAAVAQIEEKVPGWGGHPYSLTMAVCPTKNTDRYEWFAEKATEMGVDTIVPVIGDHSERKVFKTDRVKRIVLSAVKQSLKAAIPDVRESISVSEFIRGCDAELKMIAYCFEGERISIKDILTESSAEASDIAILIGPEGDFSREEVKLALECGFRPVHLGSSRLRTETAAVFSCAAVYYSKIQ